MNVNFDIEKIKKLIENLYLINPCRIAFFDAEYREIYTHSGRLSEFCSTLRQNEILNDKCRVCDNFHFELCKKQGSTLRYACHIGLYEIIVPILFDGKAVGYLMAGQIRSVDDSFDLDSLLTKLNAFEFDNKQLINSFEKLYTSTPDQITAIQHLLEMCAFYISSNHLTSFGENPRKLEIDSYITSHINEELTVSRLCEHFGYGKTMFYRITNDIYGVSIMHHIKNVRIQKSKELLIDTTMKIHEIAELVGFFDYNYFTKIFKKEVHCTPRVYRKNRITADTLQNSK